MLKRDRTPVKPLCYTIEETAQLLGYSVRTIRRLIYRGELKTCGAGKLLRVLYSSILAYIERHRN